MKGIVVDIPERLIAKWVYAALRVGFLFATMSSRSCGRRCLRTQGRLDNQLNACIVRASYFPEVRS